MMNQPNVTAAANNERPNYYHGFRKRVCICGCGDLCNKIWKQWCGSIGENGRAVPRDVRQTAYISEQDAQAHVLPHSRID